MNDLPCPDCGAIPVRETYALGNTGNDIDVVETVHENSCPVLHGVTRHA